MSRKLFGPTFTPNVPSKSPRFAGQSPNKPSGSLTNTGASGMPRNSGGGGIPGAISAAGSRYINDPNFRASVNDAVGGIARTIKPASGGGSGGGYLSSSPNPAEVKFSTSIPLTTLEKNYTKAQENVCAPMHITCARFNLPTASTSIINAWYNQVNTRDYQTRVQEQVNWAVDIVSKFSATNITTAMNDLYYALQVYFFYRGIDSYVSVGTNQNDAMYAIRNEWTFSTYTKLQEIARLLARTPLPPNMLEICRYMNSTFLSGQTPNSPIICMVPFARNSQSTLTSDANLDTVITALSNATSIDVWNTLGRVCKNWMPGTPDRIYDPPSAPIYDANFVTIFNNLPSANGITGKVYSPNAPDALTNFSYLSWINELDGMSIAFTDVYNTTSSSWTTGMVQPLASSGNSRFSYYVVSSVNGWYPSRTYPFLQYSRLETFLSDGTTETTPHRFGSDMVINLSGQMLSTTAINAVDFLLSSSSIKADTQRAFIHKPSVKRKKFSKGKTKERE